MGNCDFLIIFEVTDVTQQKKAYRILEQICGADSESSKSFVVSHLKELQEILLKTLASSSSASKTVSAAMVVMNEVDLFCKGLIERINVMNKTLSDVNNLNILQNMNVTICAFVIYF